MQPTKLLAVALLTLAAACGGDGEGEGETAATDSAPTDTAGMAATPAAPAMGDPEIAAVLAASDSAEILPSQLVAQKGQNAQVKEFAQRMLTDHGALSDSLKAMAQQAGIMPSPNAISQQMQSTAQSSVQSLQGLSGAEFDRAYMQAMVQSHEAALNTITTQLIPSAQNPQLRTALEQKVRPAVEMHLQQARTIAGSLGGQ
jgi:putative membrane protein